MNLDEIKAKIPDYSWYHAIQFAEGVVSPGRFASHIPPNYTLFPVFKFLEHIDLAGIDCIDIGATDGLTSFIVKLEGASRVVATDRGERDAFRFTRDALGLDVDYFPATTLDGGDLLQKLQANNLPVKYDLVVLSGVIYHAYDPLLVMMHARKLLKPKGLFIVESVIAPGEEDALYMNWEIDKPVREANSYFLPTLKAFAGLLRFCSCSCLTLARNGTRGAAIGRACPPSEIDDCSDMLKLIIEKGVCYGPISYKELEKEAQQGEVSPITYSGPSGEIEIDAKLFSTRFALQPPSLEVDS
ncbi:methyltransferase domain-containing protein [Egbenema bharatensis]|uniref:methyltransferase domain-containing protein n=1 Tax=Egbenema bharatensis TaxID=3463334 RepID=UPI003A86AFF1